MIAGVTMIPGAPQLTSADIRYRINNSQAKCVFADNTAAEKLDAVTNSDVSIVHFRTRVIQ